MNNEKVKEQIVSWLKNQIAESKQKGFVVGVSGGIDSAVVSTLCAETELPTILVSLPILQPKNQIDRAAEHITNLSNKYKNIVPTYINLTDTFEKLQTTLPTDTTELSLANTRSRLRMVTLYALANSYSYLVAGTGNKVEDYGIGFFSKYGDGGVDISPIGDLLKSEVYELGRYLNVSESILKAKPTDGLWLNDKSDEDQIGATYDELEWAMNYIDNNKLDERQLEVLKIYNDRHTSSKHKMNMPPICKIV